MLLDRMNVPAPTVLPWETTAEVACSALTGIIFSDVICMFPKPFAVVVGDTIVIKTREMLQDAKG